MLRIHVECPECNGIFDVKAFRAGHRVACKLCGSVVRVPVEGETTLDPNPDPDPAAVDQATRDTRPLLRRKSFSKPSKSDDAIYDDIFADTDKVLPRSSRSGGHRFELSRPLRLRIGIGVAILLALYVAYRAGRGSTPPPTPIVPVTPSPG
jgi:hypothetical protein